MIKHNKEMHIKLCFLISNEFSFDLDIIIKATPVFISKNKIIIIAKLISQIVTNNIFYRQISLCLYDFIANIFALLQNDST